MAAEVETDDRKAEGDGNVIPSAGLSWYAAQEAPREEIGPQLPQKKGWSLELMEAGRVEIGGCPLQLVAQALQPAHAHRISDKRDTQGTGFVLWDAAIVLARCIEANFVEWFGADCVHSIDWVELGAGLGLPGMAVAALGHSLGHRVTLTDLPELVPALRTRLEANALDNASACEFSWGNPPPAPATGDRVLAADCVWHEAQVLPFVNALCQAMREDGLAFVCQQRRSSALEARLREACGQHFTVEDLDPEAYHPQYGDMDGWLYILVCRRHVVER